jgi:ABC-type transport system involved in multi-copper enzyme maturation permease subunit
MSASPIVSLIAKDVYLYRWMTLGSLLAGLASIPLWSLAGTLGIVGQILFVTILVVHGAILAVHGPLSERQTRTLAFVLSLPVSPLQVALARIAAALVSYAIPWGSLLLTLLGLQLGWPSESSNLPFTVGLMVFLLANFCVLLAIAMIGRSELWCITGIIATNTAVPVFMNSLLLPLAPRVDGVAHWTPALSTTLAALILIAVVALAGIVITQLRRREFL